MRRSDSSIIDKWRSETLLSIAANPEFVRGLNEMVQVVANALKEALNDNFPILFFLNGCFAKLQEQIVKPAVDLAIMIQTSTVSYRFFPQLTDCALQVEQVIFPSALDHAIVRDIETRKTLTLRSKVVSDKIGCVGDRIMITEPGLMRCGTNLRNEVVVRKPQLAVFLMEPLGKRQK